MSEQIIIENEDEWLSDELLLEINHVISDINAKKDDHVDSAKFVDDFLSTKGLTTAQNEEIRILITQKLQSENSSDNRSVVIEKKPRFTIDEMKKIVEPNMASAAGNYLRFVKPYEKSVLGDAYDPERYKKELEFFQGRQAEYIVEDLGGNMTMHDRHLAIEALMAMLPDAIRRYKERMVQTKENEDIERKNKIENEKTRVLMVKKQKQAILTRVESVAQALSAIDEKNEAAVEAFWQDIAQDMREKDGLTDPYLEETIRKFRLHWKNLYVADQKKNDESGLRPDDKNDADAKLEKKVQETPKEKIDNPVNERARLVENADELKRLEVNMHEARELYVKKKFAHERSWSRVSRFFGDMIKGESNAGESDIELYRKEYTEAKIAYRNAMVGRNRSSTIEEAQRIMEQAKEFDIMEGCAFYDAQELLRAETMGGKIAQIVKNVSSHMKRLSPIMRRTFCAVLLAGSVIAAGHMIGDKQQVPQYDQESTMIVQQKLDHAQEDFRARFMADSIRDRVERERKTKAIEQEFPQKTDGNKIEKVSVKDKGSVNRSVRAYLKTHFAQLIADGKFFSDPDESVKFESHLSEKEQENFGALLQGKVNPKILNQVVEWKAVRLIDDFEKKYAKKGKLDHVQPKTDITLAIGEHGVEIMSVGELGYFKKQETGDATTKIDVEDQTLVSMDVSTNQVVSAPDHVDETAQDNVGESLVNKYSELVKPRNEIRSANVDMEKTVNRNSDQNIEITVEEEMKRIKDVLNDPKEGQVIKQQVFDQILHIFGDQKDLHDASPQQRRSFAQKIANLRITDVQESTNDVIQKERITSALEYMPSLHGVTKNTKFANYLFRVIIRERMMSEHQQDTI